jgi:hypothetical protein
MEESGEWDRLYEEFYPSVEKPKAEVIDISEQIKRKKKAQELTEKIMSGEIDPDAIEALLKNGTR